MLPSAVSPFTSLLGSSCRGGRSRRPGLAAFGLGVALSFGCSLEDAGSDTPQGGASGTSTAGVSTGGASAGGTGTAGTGTAGTSAGGSLATSAERRRRGQQRGRQPGRGRRGGRRAWWDRRSCWRDGRRRGRW